VCRVVVVFFFVFFIEVFFVLFFFFGGFVLSVAAPLVALVFSVEILSPSNTKREMSRKLREYFDAGAGLVWYIDPDPRTVAVYSDAGDPKIVLNASGFLDGDAVLPGFRLSLTDLVSALEQQARS
jgi:Uma2 family endonuclease